MVKLNNTLLVTAAAVITTSARANIGAGRLTLAPPLRLAGDETSCGQVRANTQPHTSAATPGRTKAARQPNHWIKKPVSKAATATPKLPARPLKPMVAPGLDERSSNMGMPTGW